MIRVSDFSFSKKCVRDFKFKMDGRLDEQKSDGKTNIGSCIFEKVLDCFHDEHEDDGIFLQKI
jgi:hypothetical protein